MWSKLIEPTCTPNITLSSFKPLQAIKSYIYQHTFGLLKYSHTFPFLALVSLSLLLATGSCVKTTPLRSSSTCPPPCWDWAWSTSSTPGSPPSPTTACASLRPPLCTTSCWPHSHGWAWKPCTCTWRWSRSSIPTCRCTCSSSAPWVGVRLQERIVLLCCDVVWYLWWAHRNFQLAYYGNWVSICAIDFNLRLLVLWMNWKLGQNMFGFNIWHSHTKKLPHCYCKTWWWWWLSVLLLLFYH